MNKITLSLLACAAMTSSLSTHALQADLSEAQFLTTGTLTINASGMCTGKVTLKDVSLYQKIDPQSNHNTTIPVNAVRFDGEGEINQLVNYYGLVVIDNNQDLIAAYAPARMMGADISSNGINVQKFMISESNKAAKSTLQFSAAQDSTGALYQLFSYIDDNHREAFKCKGTGDDRRLDTLNESASTFSLTDNSTQTYPNKYNYKTQFKAKTVASVTGWTFKETNTSGTMTQQANPLTFSVSFSGGASGTYDSK